MKFEKIRSGTKYIRGRIDHISRQRRLQCFWFAYFYGMIGAAIVAFWYQSFILITGVGHVITLTLLGWLLVADVDKFEAGTKIQNAGYLHTLLGVTGALLQIGLTPEFSIPVMLPPLGSALVTSILGWFFGQEFTDQRLPDGSEVVRSGLERVVRELNGFSSAIRDMHEQYISVLQSSLKEMRTFNREMLGEYDTLRTKQTANMSTLISMAGELNAQLHSVSSTLKTASSSLKTLPNTAQTIGDEFGSVAEETKNLAHTAKDVATYLQESQVLIQELRCLITFVTEVRK